MKKIFTIVFVIMLTSAFIVFAPRAYAEDEKPPQSDDLFPPKEAQDPEQMKKLEEIIKTEKEEFKENFDFYVIKLLEDDCLTADEMLNATIIEESFLAKYKEDEAGKKTRICERVTFCETFDGETGKYEFCRTEFQNSCTPVYSEDQKVSCQRVQAIFGSGTGLVANYVGLIYRWAASLVGIIAVLIIVFSGVQIAASGGDSAKVDAAKNRIIQSVAGLALLFLASLILYSINPNFFT